jgi:hypothetical protein
MAEYSTNLAGFVIALDHNETQQLLDLVPAGEPKVQAAVAGILVAAGISNVWVGAIASCIALHIWWETAAVRASDQGYGVYLTLSWVAITTGNPHIVIPGARPAPYDPPAPEWAATAEGDFGTQDRADRIHYTINHEAVAADEVHFRLIVGPNSSGWKKAINMPNGTGSSWLIEAEGRGSFAENALWAHEMQNGQSLTFIKAKAFGQMVPVQDLRPLDSLQGGDRVDFIWQQDT